jgi:hypothetical protein
MGTNLANTVPARPTRSETSQDIFRYKLQAGDTRKAQVVVPEAVDVPLPKAPDQQIAVPASINGRDLSGGKP